MALSPYRLCLLGVVWICFSVARSECPGGWSSVSGRCYLLQRSSVDHAAATALCRLYNASLVSIQSQHERQVLLILMKAAGVQDHGQEVKYWTGLSSSGQSLTWSDGTAFNKSLIPAVSADTPLGLSCASMASQDAFISFETCSQLHRPLCERSAADVFVDKCNFEDGWRDIGGQCYKLYDVTSSWSDARQQCLRHNGDLFSPAYSNHYPIDSLVTCRISVSHIWLGISDTAHPGTLMTTSMTKPSLYWAHGDGVIIEPGKTCAEAVTTPTSVVRFQTDVCRHEKQFICQKPYGTCPGGWDEHQGRCYQVQGGTTAATTWFLAKQRCHDQGAQLLILNSMDEHMYISKKLIEYNMPSTWLGFSDEVESDVLRWVDGTSANGTGVFGVWSPHYPYPVPGRFDCGILQVGSSNGSWSHGYCYTARSFVCELHIGKILTPPPSTYDNYTCDDGWDRFQDHCFRLGDAPSSWDAASVSCRDQGAVLAVIKDPYVQSFVTEKLPDTGTAWIGLKMDPNNHRYYWTDNTEANFTNYVPGEPDGGYEGDYCVDLVATGSLNYPGGWADGNCSTQQDFVCHKPADQITSFSPPPTYAWTARCEPGWHLNSQDEQCYLVQTDAPLTWLHASYDCHRRQAALLSLSGPNEQLHIEAVLSTYYPLAHTLWTGASDSSQEGGWGWSDGSPFRYLHWHPGQPDSQGDKEDCAELVLYWNYQWNDRNCDNLNDYICKKPAKPPATSPAPSVPTVAPVNTCQPGPVISGQYSVQSASAFTASSELDANHTAADLRLIDSNLKSWRPSRDQQGEWVGVTFYQVMSLDSMTISGEANSFSYVTSFKVQYQYSVNSAWYWIESAKGVPMVFSGPTDDQSSTIAFFPSAIHARSLRLFPLAWGAHIAVRWELDGCVLEPCSMDYALSGPLVVMEEAFTASSMADFRHSAHNARLHPIALDTLLACWRPGGGGDPPPWIEVDLGAVRHLRGVTLMGNPDADEYVTNFQLQYRPNSKSDPLETYQQPYGIPMNFTGNTAGRNNSVTHLLQTVLPARHVRLVVLDFVGHVAVRFDILVCSSATCRATPLLSGQHNVSNSAFTASTSLDPQHGPFRARLGQPHYAGRGGAWAAGFNDDHQYIQVDLGESFRVWAVATQGSEDLRQWVRSYRLAFSQDGHNFTTYSLDGITPLTLDANFDASTVRKQYLLLGTVARYVQLWPYDFHDGIALRLEVYGCPGPDSGQYVGCFLDEPTERDLPFEPVLDLFAHLGPISCQYHCYDKGYAFAGLQRGISCYCGNSYGRHGASLSACTARCLPPFEHKICGGHLANSVYTTGLAAPHDSCRAGWVGQGGSCYMVLEDLHTWFQAHDNCHKQGAELVTISSEVENDLVFSLLASMSVQGVYGSAWTGFNDLEETFYYQWRDGAEVTFTNWDQGMPLTDPTQEQHCVAINNKTGGWKTVFCEERLMYVCKMPKQPSPIPHLPPLQDGCGQVGWSAFKGSCYTVLDEPRTWALAALSCATSGGFLVRINDRSEQAYVSTLLGSGKDYHWSDVTADQASVYRFSDHTPVTFTYWGPRQPGPQGCVGLRGGRHAGLWYSLNCSSAQLAVCEMPRAGVTPMPTQPLVPPGARCPDGWYETRFSCYQVNTRLPRQQLSWDEAREDCQNQGADLASFHSHLDLEDVWRNVMSGGVNAYNLWIGLMYSDQDQSLKWSDGSGVDFVQWAADESWGLQGLANCVEVRVDTGDMARQRCSFARNWVCSLPRGAVLKPRTTVTAPTPAAPGSCLPLDDGWVKYGGSCYHVQTGAGDTAMTWREARTWCNDVGTELASILTPTEQLFLQTLIQDVSSISLWIGLNKLDIDRGFQWSDGSPAAYVNWDAREPNNFGDLEYCVGMLTKNGKWNDDTCTRKHGFVCKQPPQGATLPATSPTPAPRGDCPGGYRLFRGRCLRVFGGGDGERRLDWSAARRACASLGPGHSMASIGSLAENLFVVTLMGDDQMAVWTGLTRLADGTMAWTDNSEVTFTFWDDGEPSGGVDSCVYMKGSSNKAGLWNDAPCGQMANYVCQTRPDPSIVTPEPIPNPCDAHEGFKPFRSGCYKYVDAPANWTAASDACHMVGAELTTVDDAFVHAFLRLFVASSAGVEVGSDQVPSVWIGLNDLKTRDVYVWTLGWPVTFSRWGPGEPARGRGEGCVLMDGHGRWVDADCGQSLTYVCAVINAPQGSVHGGGVGGLPDACFLLRGDDRRTFYEAQLGCREQEGYLASVHHNDTGQFLANMVSPQTELAVWIGLYGSLSGGFSWLDHSAVQFLPWAPSQPSGTSSEGIAQQCVALDPRTRLWNDLDCDLRLGYICRKAQVVDQDGKTLKPLVNGQTPPVPPTLPAVSQLTPGIPTPGNKYPPVATSTTNGVSSRSHNGHVSSTATAQRTSSTTAQRTASTMTAHSTALPAAKSEAKTGRRLSSGAVAGIIVTLVLVVVGVMALLILRRHRQARQALTTHPHAEPGFSNMLYNYNTTTSSPPLGARPDDIDLSEIAVTGNGASTVEGGGSGEEGQGVKLSREDSGERELVVGSVALDDITDA